MWELEVILCLKCSLKCLVFSQNERKKQMLAQTDDGRISVAQYKTKRTLHNNPAHLKGPRRSQLYVSFIMGIALWQRP